MSKLTTLWRINFALLRLYMIGIVGIAIISFLVDLIVWLNNGTPENDDGVSLANILILFIVIMGILLPLNAFRKSLNLGANRSEYFWGAASFYTCAALLLAVINTGWQQIEYHIHHGKSYALNLLEVFHWTQFGSIGSILYQFSVYIMIASLLNLLFSGIRHYTGWIVWVVLIAAIPISTSIPSLSTHTAEFFMYLLFNDSLAQGCAINILLTCLFLMGSWIFTLKRPI